MTSLIWISLAVGIVVVVAGAVVLGVRVLAAWRCLRSFQKRLSRSVIELEDSVARAERRLARTTASAERLAVAQSRLQDSLAAASILAEAAGETRAMLGAVRAFMPRK